MELKDVLPILFERSNATQTFWNFYIVIALGIIGFFSTAKPVANLKAVQILFTLGYLMFAAVNLLAMLWVIAQRQALAGQALRLITGDQLALLKQSFLFDKDLLSPPSWIFIGIFHLIGDALIIGVIWLLPRRRTL
jgi:hypothetical protein